MTSTNATAETSLLAFLASDGRMCLEIDPQLFFNHCNRLIFEVMRDLAGNDITPGMLAVTAELERRRLLDVVGGPFYVTEIFTAWLGPASPDMADHYREILEEAAQRRRFMAALAEAQEEIKNPRADIPAILAAIQTAAQAKRVDLPDLGAQLLDVITELESQERKQRFSTGIPALDDLIGGGIERKEMLVIAANTGRGKSLLLGMGAVAAISAATNPARTAFFSLEMAATALLLRLLRHHSGKTLLPLWERSDKMQSGEMQALNRTINHFQRAPLTVFDSETELGAILAAASRVKRVKGGLDVLAIDYVQRIEFAGEAKGDNRERRVSACARRMKNFGLENDCAVLTACQVNSEGEMRESKAIGHEADTLVQIREEGDKTLIEVIKCRRAKPGGVLVVNRRGDLGRFELADNQDREEPKHAPKRQGDWRKRAYGNGN